MNLPLQPQNVLIQITYLVSSILFIIGIKMMNKTKDARNGNFLSAVGMLLAIAATLLQVQLVTFTEILICFALGSVIGLYYAYKVEMTKIPIKAVLVPDTLKGYVRGRRLFHQGNTRDRPAA